MTSQQADENVYKVKSRSIASLVTQKNTDDSGLLGRFKTNSPYVNIVEENKRLAGTGKELFYIHHDKIGRNLDTEAGRGPENLELAYLKANYRRKTSDDFRNELKRLFS